MRPCEISIVVRRDSGSGNDDDGCSWLREALSGKSLFNVRPAYTRSVQDAVLRKAYPACDENAFQTPAEVLDLENEPSALSALASAIEYAYDRCEASVRRLQRPKRMSPTKNLCMAPDSLQQLDVVEALERRLNRCRTPTGRRAFRRRLTNPWSSSSMDEIVASLDAIDRVKPNVRDVRAELSRVGDVERLFKRVVLKKATFADMANMIVSADAVAAAIVSASSCAETMAGIEPARRIARFLDERLDPTTRAGPREGSGMFPQCDAAKRDLDLAYDQVRHLEAHVENVKIDDDHRTISFTMTQKRFDAAKSSSATYADMTLDASRKLGGPTIARIQQAYAAARAAMQKALSDALATISDGFVAAHADDVAAVVDAIERLDVASTCALNSIELRHVRPVFIGSSDASSPRVPARCDASSPRVRARGLRHPLIESSETSVERFKPNDVELDYGAGAGGILLYGINAAGKSSIMKSLGVALIMAHAGMHVACDASFELTPLDVLLTRIGMRDDILRGRSTFVVEMLELKAILERINDPSKRCLVIGDELCAGTESLSAVSIVGASIKALAARRVPFIFATHLHELVDRRIVEDAQGVVAMHMSVRFDETTGTMLYERKMVPGKGPSTYGIEVCRSVGLPIKFVGEAERIRRCILMNDTRSGSELVIKKTRSKYNARVVVDSCGVCGGRATETHHIQHRKDGGSNCLHNLTPLCHECHLDAHGDRLDIDGFALTDKGHRLQWRRKIDE